MLEQLIDRQADVFGDLTKQCRRNVASLMKRYSRPATVGMAKLSVRASLADFYEPKLSK